MWERTRWARLCQSLALNQNVLSTQNLHIQLLFAIMRMVTPLIVTIQKATMVVTNTNNTSGLSNHKKLSCPRTYLHHPPSFGGLVTMPLVARPLLPSHIINMHQVKHAFKSTVNVTPTLFCNKVLCYLVFPTSKVGPVKLLIKERVPIHIFMFKLLGI